jgi:aminopeptidase
MYTLENLSPLSVADLDAAWTELAARHLAGVVGVALAHPDGAPALLVHDRRTGLSRALAQGYRRNLPQARCIDFDTVDAAAVLAAFKSMPPGALVVLVQSTNFRLDGFRIRVELFKLGLKVIEHVHLSRMPGEQGHRYIEALEYDAAYYRGVGRALKARIDAAQEIVVCGGAERLVFTGGMEPAKLNIGDYSDMPNAGGQFPIGEVFSEALDLEAVNGRVLVHVFGDTSYRVNCPAQPIVLQIDKGRVVAAEGATPAFQEVLDIIRRDEGEVWLRELGFGMNRAFTRERRVDDIGTYERMCGIHLSLGAKHGVYPKPGFKRKDARYHIDVFAVTDAVLIDGVNVYLSQGGTGWNSDTR